MYCNKCGKVLPDGAKFCSGCGSNIEELETKGPSATETTNPTQERVTPSGQPAESRVASSVSVNNEVKNDASMPFFVWDIVGLIATGAMFIAFFLPSLIAKNAFVTTSTSISIAQLFSEASANSYTKDFSMLLLIYLVPAVCCALDFLIRKENSSRYIRLIVIAVLNIMIQSSVSGVGKLLSSFGSATLGAGYYVSVVSSVAIIIVAIGAMIAKNQKKQN